MGVGTDGRAAVEEACPQPSSKPRGASDAAAVVIVVHEIHANRHEFEIVEREGEGESEVFTVKGTNIDVGRSWIFRGAGEVWSRTSRNDARGEVYTDMVGDEAFVSVLREVTDPRRR